MTLSKHLLSFFLALLIIVSGAPQANAQSDDLYPIRVNGKFGLADITGKVVVAAQYDSGLIESPHCFFVEGLGSVQVGGKWGYIDRTGKMVITPQFDSTSSFREGIAVVETGDDEGVPDKRPATLATTPASGKWACTTSIRLATR